MLENFHFIRPLWLFALLPLALVAWRAYRPGGADNPWTRVIDAQLLPLLLLGRTRQGARTALWLLAAGWTLAVLALANPTWQERPLPLYQTTAARVIVLELSRSMYADDLKPSRLARARYKIEDVLAQSSEGQTGLVVYAGAAFTVTPLTRDVNTIRAMMPALDPDIMPAEGSRADLGLLRAGKLLRQAGAGAGDVLLIADGVRKDDVAASVRAAARLRSDGYRVSVLGIGARDGVALTDARGELLRDADGRIERAHFDTGALRAVARAGGGEYRSMSDDGAALNALLHQPAQARPEARAKVATQQWIEQGPLLAALLLPLAALAFRRNWLLSLLLLLSFAAPPRPALAAGWEDLWSRPDQRAAKALDSGDYATAAALATDAMRRGSAEYRRGEYRRALDAFAQASGTDADYNRGNALAKLGRYEEAVAAYAKALKEDPRNADARANKAAVEALLQQQRAQPKSGAAKAASGQGKHSGAQGAGQSSRGDNGSQPASPSQGAAVAGRDQQAGNTGQGKAPQGSSAVTRAQPQRKQAAGAQAGGKQGATAEPQSAAVPDTFAAAEKKLAQEQAPQAQAAQAQQEHASQAAQRAAVAAASRAQQGAKPRSGAAGRAQPLDNEERTAAQQWLRRIPDDPGGLLRRKFLYQYRRREEGGGNG